MSKAVWDALRVEMWVGATCTKEGIGGWAVHLQSNVLNHDFKKTSAGYAEDTTITRMGLKAIVEGLTLLKKKTFVTIYTDIPQVSKGINQHLAKWHRNGWVKDDGDILHHADLWMQLYELLLGENRITMAYSVKYKKDSLSVDNNVRVVHTAAIYAQRAKKQIKETAYGVVI